jgi:hypothetical protein|tara:strand:+ start:1540 stop:1821 length:282 start_codon:yes stop_codon:yes gene_type:complete
MTKPLNPVTTYIDDRQLSLEELQGLVGGRIQLVAIQTDDGKEKHIIMDEEGKLKNKPINAEATKLWFPEDSLLTAPDWIVGNAVVLSGKALLQ